MDAAEIDVEPRFSRTVFARDEGQVQLDWVLKNNSSECLSGKVLLTACEEPLMKERDVSLLKGEELLLHTRFSPGKFRVGAVDILLHFRPEDGDTLKKKVTELRIGPWRNPQRLPVSTWPRVKETSCIKEMRHVGITVPPFADISDLDDITLLGGYGGRHLGTYEFGEDVCLTGKEYLDKCKKAVEDFLAEYENHPSIKLVVLNTERWGKICFCERCRKRYEENTGIDVDVLAEHVEKGGPRRWKSHVLIPPIEQYMAEGGVVGEDNPLLRFGYWWWEKGGLNVGNQLMAELLHMKSPGIMPITEPVERFGAVKRYRSPIVMSDWKYPGKPESWLPMLAYLKGIQKLWGVQFIPTVGLIKLAGGFAPYAVTNPPDLVKIETWLCLAHIPDGIDYWYWQGVQSPEQPYWGSAPVQECERVVKGLPWKEACKVAAQKHLGTAWVPGVPEAIRTLSERVFKPLGPLITRLELKPARIAVLYSFTSTIMGGRPWYVVWSWYPVVEKLLSGPYYVDVIFDYDIKNKSVLDRYKAVILPSAFVLERKGLKALQDYMDRGGLVLGGESQKGNLSGLRVITDLDNKEYGKSDLDPDSVWRELAARIEPEKVCDNNNIVLRESQGNDTRVLFAVNNCRAPGPLFGHYEGALETGMPAQANIKILKEDWRYCYELTSSESVELQNQGRYWLIKDDFPPAWGRIYAFYKEKVGGVRISAESTVETGARVTIEVQVLTKQKRPFRGLVPVLIEISHYACTQGSRYEFSWQVPVLTRRSPGHTGQWQIQVTELASGSKARKNVEVSKRAPGSGDLHHP